MASTSYSVFTRIFGEDRASEVFRKVGQSARNAFGPIRAFNQALKEPSTTALGRVGDAADRVAAKFRGGLGSLTSWLPALGAIGSALTLGGLIAMTRHSSEGFDDLATAAEKLAVSTQSLSVWRYGARQTNVEAAALEKGLTKARKAIFDAATGKNKDVAALFAAMKIPLRDARGQIRGLEASLDDIAEAFKNTHDEETKNAAAMALFGKSGADMIPFLNRGRAGIAEWRAEMARFVGLTDDHRRSLGDLDVAYKRLDKAGGGLADRLSAAMAPALTRVVNWTTDWIVANRELIAQSIEKKIQHLGQAFDFVSGAIRTVLDIPWIAEFLRGVDASTAFDIGLGALGLTMAGPLAAAISIVTKAAWGMNAAFLANPFVLVAAAIAGAALAVYANWGPITSWFQGQMDIVRDAFDRGWGSGLWELFTRFNPFRLITTAVNGLSKWLFDVDLYAAGARLLQRLIDGIKSLLPDFEAIWGKIKSAVSWLGTPEARASMAQFGPDAAAAAALAPPIPRGTTDFGPDVAGIVSGAPRLPQPPSPGSPAGVAAVTPLPVNNTISIIVNKAAPDTTIETRSSGGSAIKTNVGYSMMDDRPI